MSGHNTVLSSCFRLTWLKTDLRLVKKIPMPAVKLTFVTLPAPTLLFWSFLFLFHMYVFFPFHMNQAEFVFVFLFFYILTNHVSHFISVEFHSSLHLSVSSFTHCQSWHSLSLLLQLSSLIPSCLRRLLCELPCSVCWLRMLLVRLW